MATIRNVRLDDWRDFKRDLAGELFQDGVLRRDHFLFRGMRSPAWRLEPSFDRAFRHVDVHHRPALFARLLRSFRDECREFGVPSDVHGDDHRLIALGQHHGLPTRLLDWTTSPYVAAYFAFEHALDAQDGFDSHVALWALHRLSPVWNGQHEADIVTVRSQHNVRVRNQFGCFTLSRGSFECLEDLVVGCADVDGVALTRILLPASEAPAALTDLDLMGINALSLFPDLSGAAAACWNRLVLEDL